MASQRVTGSSRNVTPFGLGCHACWPPSSSVTTPREVRFRYGPMAVLAPDCAMSAGLADGRPALLLSGHFLAMWPILLHMWHFLSSSDICGLGQFSLVWPVMLHLNLLCFGSLGGVATRCHGVRNRPTGAPRCGRPGLLSLPEFSRT